MKNLILSLDNISLNLPGVEKPILSNINYKITEGDFIVILGSNGSGKSSLLKCIDQRYQPTSGKISFIKSKMKITTLGQNCHESLFPTLTILENYYLFSSGKKTDKEFFINYLNEFNPNLSIKLDQLVQTLSGGEKQALALALSVLYPPDILLLDEHTSALDPKSAQTLMEITHRAIQQHNITCMLTTHDLDIASQYGNRILALRNGRMFQVIEHEDKKVLDQNKLLAACY